MVTGSGTLAKAETTGAEHRPVDVLAKGSWGPAAADTLVAEFGGWHGPWVVS